MQSSKDGAVIAKIKAIYGKRIRKNQFIELSNCKNVNSIATYLKNNTNYRKILKDTDENTIHRGQLENLIRQHNFNKYENLYPYLSKSNEAIFKIAIEEFELLEILKIILLLKSNNMKEYIINLPGYLISKCNLNLLNLAKIKNYEELLNLLKHTHYYSVLNKLKPENESNKIDYNACEHELFKQFFVKTFKTIEKNIKNNEKKELKSLIKIQIDYLNACCIYRKKIIFNESAENINKQLFPFGKNLNDKNKNILIESKNNHEFGLKLKKMFKNSENLQTIFKKEDYYIENFIAKINYKFYKRLIHLYNSFPVVFYAFHKLSQIEVSNLIYVIESVRYGINTKEIQNLYVF